MNKNPKNQLGFATIEILIALMIIVLAISTTIIMVFGSGKMTLDSSLAQEALYRAQSLQENTRAETKTNWNAVATNSLTSGIFTEDTEVLDMAEYKKLLKNTVSWADSGRTLNAGISTILTDWQEIKNQGACADVASSDWTHPSISHFFDLGLTPVREVTGVDVKNGIAYVTVDGDGTQKDFFAIDVVNSNILWSLDTGPGLMGIKVVGDYAYVANSSVNSQLQIIDLTLHSYVNYKIPGSTIGDVSSIYYFDKKIYLGTPTSVIPEFHIIDVSQNSNIHEVGVWEFNQKVNNIYVSNGFAYIAVPDNTEELKILDVHDPANIKSVTGFDAPGSSGNGRSFGRKKDKLFFGRTAGNIELYVLDLNNINAGYVASQDINNSTVSAIATIGDFAFLALNETVKGFRVYKLEDTGASFTLQSTLDIPAKGLAIDCEGQNIYLTTNNSSKGLLVIKSN